jgi:hypothetical protein
LVLEPSLVPLCNRRGEVLLDQQVLWHLVGRSPNELGMPSPSDKVLRESQTETQDTKSIQEAIFISVQQQLSRFTSKGWL